MLQKFAPKYVWILLALVCSVLSAILAVWYANTAKSHGLLVHVVEETDEMQTVANMREAVFFMAYELYREVEEFYHGQRPLDADKYHQREARFRESQRQFLASHLITNAETDSWARANVIVERSFDLQNQVIALHQKGNYQGADKLLAQEVLPVTNQALEALEEILGYQREEMREAVEESLATIDTSKTFIAILTALIFAMAVAIVAISRREQALAVDRLRVLHELEQAKEQAVAANKAKSDVLARTSHDLRTPLNVMIGYSELIREELSEGRSRELIPDVDRLVYSSRHLLGLINDILDLSKIEEGKLEILPEVFALDAFIVQISEEVAPITNGNRFVVDLQTDSIDLETDPMRLRQILLNLLSNAFKFTHAGTVNLQVDSVSGPAGDRLLLSVSDTGPGMSDSQLSSLFTAYQQGDRQTAKLYGGTGLGLAICRNLCNLLGGEITVQSRIGLGTTFHVTLPCRMQKDRQMRTAI